MTLDNLPRFIPAQHQPKSGLVQPVPSNLAGEVVPLVSGWQIVRRTNIAGGSPTIEGTRIRVADIVGYRRLGYSKPRIRRAMPHLTDAQIRAALDYYKSHAKEIDKEIVKEEALAKRAKTAHGGRRRT